MTKRQRAQVVELLRCAADISATATDRETAPFILAGAGAHRDIYNVAWRARCDTMRGSLGEVLECGNNQYAELLLEAAMRVEEGTWP